MGGGFAGLEAAKALWKAPVHVILVDRRIHHLFQPLLYQAACTTLSPADISAPIRHILRRQRNLEGHLGEVVCVDLGPRRVRLPTAWIAGELFLAAMVGGGEPRGQRKSVLVLLGALIIVVFCSLLGEMAGRANEPGHP